MLLVCGRGRVWGGSIGEGITGSERRTLGGVKKVVRQEGDKSPPHSRQPPQMSAGEIGEKFPFTPEKKFGGAWGVGTPQRRTLGKKISGRRMRGC